jgi:hypothetical protein
LEKQPQKLIDTIFHQHLFECCGYDHLFKKDFMDGNQWHGFEMDEQEKQRIELRQKRFEHCQQKKKYHQVKKIPKIFKKLPTQVYHIQRKVQQLTLDNIEVRVMKLDL